MQLWIKINAVALHKVVKTMPRQMCSVIKAKGGPTKYAKKKGAGFLYRQCISVYNIIYIKFKSVEITNKRTKTNKQTWEAV